MEFKEQVLNLLSDDDLFNELALRAENYSIELSKLIEFRGELSARIEKMNGKRYLLEVRNDVSNLNDSEADDVLEDLIKRFDVDVVKEKNEWDNDN